MRAIRIIVPLLALPLVVSAAPASAGHDDDTPVTTEAELETPPLFDDAAGGHADADDPAIWRHPRGPEGSLVIGTKKDAGLDVYDMDGERVQDIPAPPPPGPGDAPGRLNNVALTYGLLPDSDADVAVVSDRGHDKLRFYAIDPGDAAASEKPLTDITAPDMPYLFNETQQEVNREFTAYGATTWRDSAGQAYAVVSQADRPNLAMAALQPGSSGVGYEVTDRLQLPTSFQLPDGTRWTPCNEPGEGPQFEGLVVDRERGVLYAGQEQVGIWRIPLTPDFGQPELIERVREYGVPYRYDPATEECEYYYSRDPGFSGEHLTTDVEGLTMYYADEGEGYLIASSQGDSTYAVYDRETPNSHVGSFTVDRDDGVDGTQGTDGLAVLNAAVGDFDEGLLVVHDGQNMLGRSSDRPPRESGNFKFVEWDDVAEAFDDELIVDPDGWSPHG